MADKKAQQDPGDAWSKVHKGESGFDHTKEHWTSLEAVRHRHNEIATGRPRKPWAVHLREQHLAEKPAETMCIPVKMFFEIEDALTETGEIPCDFVVVAATPKNGDTPGR